MRGNIPREILQQIRDRVDVIDVVSRYVTLSKAGQNFKGLCPFHSEKTPSFTVNQSRQMFHCFGCSTGGDVYAFLMKKEGLSFVEAVSELASQANVSLSVWREKVDQSEHRERRESLQQLQTLALSWFHANLRDPSLGHEARTYLQKRGLHSDTIEAFELGYALPAWDGLTRYLLKNGISPEVLLQSGLVVEKTGEGGKGSQSRASSYDRFRGRVMFPLADLRARVIGFGGRVLDEATPKYLNSPETPLFSKSRCLYGLTRAREAATRLNDLMIVEGYFDVMTLHQAGLTNVVAPLGTALTKEHVEIVRRFSRNILLLFDGDSAGIGAVLRTLDLFMNSGISVKVVSFPIGEDPDSFVRTRGVEAFLHLNGQAPSLLDFAVQQCLTRASKGTLEERIRCVDDVLRTLHKSDNQIEKEERIRQVAEQLGIRQQLLLERYARLIGSVTGNKGKVSDSGYRGSGFQDPVEERDLVSFLLKGELEPDHVKALRAEAFMIPVYRRIVEMGLRHLGEDGNVSSANFLEEALADPECCLLVPELTLSDRHFDDKQGYIHGCLEALERKRLRAALDGLIGQLKIAEQERRKEEIESLNVQIDILRGQKAGLAISMNTRG